MVAQEAGITRKALYRALSPTGNPTLRTLLAVLHAGGMRLSVAPAKPIVSHDHSIINRPSKPAWLKGMAVIDIGPYRRFYRQKRTSFAGAGDGAICGASTFFDIIINQVQAYRKTHRLPGLAEIAGARFDCGSSALRISEAPSHCHVSFCSIFLFGRGFLIDLVRLASLFVIPPPAQAVQCHMLGRYGLPIRRRRRCQAAAFSGRWTCRQQRQQGTASCRR